MYHFFKICIEFVTVLLLFYVWGSLFVCLFVLRWGMWDLSSLNRDRTHMPCFGRWNLTTELPGKPQYISFEWLQVFLSLLLTFLFLISDWLILLHSLFASIPLCGDNSSPHFKFFVSENSSAHTPIVASVNLTPFSSSFSSSLPSLHPLILIIQASEQMSWCAVFKHSKFRSGKTVYSRNGITFLLFLTSEIPTNSM